MSGDLTRTSIGAATLLKKDRLLAGRYRIADPVGVGGMGLVYRARDEELDLDVALKVLKSGQLADGQVLDRFKRELLTAREVSHPNVVRIHDIGQDGDIHFITMDLVEGRSLQDIVEDDGPMDPYRVAGIASGIADGLDAAHRKGVVHRDLKPANVLVDDADHPYISDFGIARSQSASRFTQEGVLVGSPDYLAPEQARGSETDHRADIYALGLTVFEMLTGELPFNGGTLDELIAQKIAGQPRDLKDMDVSVPPNLRRIVARCLARDPDDRYQSAADLAADLRADRAPSRRWASIRKPVLAAVFLVAIVAGFFAIKPMLSGSGPVDVERVAILPLNDETGDPSLAWMAVGLGEMAGLIMGQQPSHSVVDSQRVLNTLLDLQLDPSELTEDEVEQLADLLGADAMMRGTLHRSGGGVRIDGVLYEDTGSVPISVAVDNAGSVSELVQGLSDELRKALNAKPLPSEAKVLSVSPVALTAYSEGLALLHRGDAVNAVPSFERAVAADDHFAMAWMRLAEAYDMTGYSEQARRAIDTAVARASAENTRAALMIRAQQASLTGDYARSQEIYEKLVSQYPGDVGARMTLAESYGDDQRFDRANEILLDVVKEDANHPRAWYLLGKFAIQSGDSKKAIDEYLVRSLVIQNRIGNLQGRGDTLNAMGIAYLRMGDLAAAREHYKQAADVRREIGDKRGVATSLNNLARVEVVVGDYASARSRLDEAVEISREIGDQAGLASFVNSIGTLEEEQGKNRKALNHYRSALAMREELGNRRDLMESYINVGFSYFMLGELDNARIYLQRSLDDARELGNPDAEMQALQVMGMINLAEAKWDGSLKALNDALTIARDLGYPDAEAASLGHMGRIAHYQGRVNAAISLLDQAIGILEPLDDARGLTEFALRKGFALADVGMLDEAQEQVRIAAVWLEKTDNREQSVELQRLTALIAIGRSNLDEARAAVAAATAAAERSGVLISRLDAQLIAAKLALASDNPAAAEGVAEVVAHQAARSGFATVRIDALYTLARARDALGQPGRALSVVETVLGEIDRHAPYIDSHKIRRFSAGVLAANNRPEAAAQQEQAADAELERLRENLPAAALDTPLAARSQPTETEPKE